MKRKNVERLVRGAIESLRSEFFKALVSRVNESLLEERIENLEKEPGSLPNLNEKINGLSKRLDCHIRLHDSKPIPEENYESKNQAITRLQKENDRLTLKTMDDAKTIQSLYKTLDELGDTK